jgi:hypothetical protein
MYLSILKKLLTFFLFCSMLATSPIFAKTWYVSPKTDKDGWRLQGDGSAGNPWDLQTALSGAQNKIKPGDTIFVHDGAVYWGYYLLENEGKKVHAAQLYQSKLEGTENAPIIVKAFPGEHPVIDGNLNSTDDAVSTDKMYSVNSAAAVLLVTGSNTWIWGLEITNSSKNRQGSDEHSKGVQMIDGVAVQLAKNIKLINLVVHDNTTSGITTFSNAINVEIEGCLIYYNGETNPMPDVVTVKTVMFRKNGPGIYSQNRDDAEVHSVKIIRNSVIFQQFYNGIQVYGSENSFLSNFIITGNTIFNNGLISKFKPADKTVRGEYDVTIGGGTNTDRLNFSGNQCAFFTEAEIKSCAKIGYSVGRYISNVKADSNYFISYHAGGKSPLMINNAKNLEFKHNFMYGTNYCLQIAYQNEYPNWDQSFLKKEIKSDYNYFIHFPNHGRDEFLGYAHYDKNNNPVAYDFSLVKGKRTNWTDSSGQDAHSMYSDIKGYTKATGRSSDIIITPDIYEPGLAKIVIMNWDSLAEVDISAAHLIPKDNAYKFIDIQNFDGPITMEGTFSGKMALKMSGYKAAVPTGLNFSAVMVQPEHTDAHFGVFWLEYFPYKVNLEIEKGILKARFTDIKEHVVENPPFLVYQWMKNGHKVENANASFLKFEKDGNYELQITDDHGLTKIVKVKITKGKIAG